jgi:hypothetical protein
MAEIENRSTLFYCNPVPTNLGYSVTKITNAHAWIALKELVHSHI